MFSMNEYPNSRFARIPPFDLCRRTRLDEISITQGSFSKTKPRRNQIEQSGSTNYHSPNSCFREMDKSEAITGKYLTIG
jgi:hypothetical protein